MQDTIAIQIKNEVHEIEIPKGFHSGNIICAGRVKKGDLAYNARTKGFDVVKQDGDVWAEQCHLIVGLRDW